MRPRLASLIFCLIVVLAAGALAWGAAQGKSGKGIGSAKDQAAARTTLQTGLKLSGGLVRDPTFTACGKTTDACLTGSTSLATTLAALASVVHAAGGSLPNVCSAPPTGVATATGANFTCVVEGKLHGTPRALLARRGLVVAGAPDTAHRNPGERRKGQPNEPDSAARGACHRRGRRRLAATNMGARTSAVRRRSYIDPAIGRRGVAVGVGHHDGRAVARDIPAAAPV